MAGTCSYRVCLCAVMCVCMCACANIICFVCYDEYAVIGVLILRVFLLLLFVYVIVLIA